MRIIRPSTARLALIASIAVFVVACGSSGAAPILSTVGSAVDNDNAYSGNGQTGPEAGQPAASAAPTQSITEDGVGAVIDDAKIIRTGTIQLEVKDVPTALITARNGIRAMGGYVGASQTQNVDDRPLAQITYRIPASRWEDALDLLRTLNGQTTKLVSEQTEAVDVTGQVIDIEARIRNLRSSETALQKIAAGAVRIADVLEVEQQLTNVRGQIEQLSAQLADLNDRAGFATLTATFSVPVIAVEVAARGWEPSVVIDEASASLVDILQGLTTAGIWFAIVWLPVLLVLGVLIAAGIWIARRLGVIGPRRTGGVPLAG
ncbi:MAG TPA: DUF4349 domain-containing protein [Methylomirabilota bacterium]|nr:DUF4349 domain-containing protein [Methylomirabilota bacterium]